MDWKCTIGVISLAVLLSSVCGCSLNDPVWHGDACPPETIASHLSYIVTGNDEKCMEGQNCERNSFVTGFCPETVETCARDSDNLFYCIAKCPKGQIACDGQCIEPMTNAKFCGAQNACSGYECCTDYAVCNARQVCKDGTCINSTCANNGEVVCDEGVVYTCRGNLWEETQKCRSGLCGSDSACYGICELAEGENRYLDNGEQGCNSVGDIIECRDGVISLAEDCRHPEVCTADGDGFGCIEPEYKSCSYKSKVYNHEDTLCIDNIVKICQNGEFADQEKCADNKENNYCQGNMCIIPKTCMVDGGVIAHGTQLCDKENEIIECFDGTARIKEVCREDSDCGSYPSGAYCVKKYTSIPDIYSDIEHIIDLNDCKNEERAKTVIPTDVKISGVVTAVRSNRGIFIQDPMIKDGRYAGVFVYCPNGECTKYADGKSVNVNDNAELTADGFIDYYCQLEIVDYKNDKKMSIRKLDDTDKIDPVFVTAEMIETGHPTNPYNGSLVQLDSVLMQNKRTIEPLGWNVTDSDGMNLLLNQYLYSGLSTHFDKNTAPESEKYNKMYHITGIGIWNFRTMSVAPRDAADIVKIDVCKGRSGKSKCAKIDGEYTIYTCSDAAQPTVSATQVCENEICSEADDVLQCRRPNKCKDFMEQPVSEGELGCASGASLARCVTRFDEETDTNVMAWDAEAAGAMHCEFGCSTSSHACLPGTISACNFKEINAESQTAVMRVTVPDGVYVSGQFACTLDPSIPVIKWDYSADARVNKACADCIGDTVEFYADESSLPTEEGHYMCAAVVSVEDGNQYICPTVSNKPLELRNMVTASSSYLAEYLIRRPVLASWDFNTETLSLSEGEKKDSQFAIISPNSEVPTYVTGSDSGKAVSLQTSWCSADEPDFSAPHWEYTFNTEGYINITTSFKIAASGTSNKKIAAAMKIGDSVWQRIGTDMSFTSKTFQTFPKTELLNAGRRPKVTVGIFPYAVSASAPPNIRVDEVLVQGDKDEMM